MPEPLVESRYLYDPLGRRVAKRVWRRERDLTGWMSLSRKPQVTWYGLDGNQPGRQLRTTTHIRRFISRGASRHSSGLKPPPVSRRKRSAAAWRIPFGSTAAKTVAVWCSAGADAGPAGELKSPLTSIESHRWLASCSLTVEQMQNQMDPVYTPARKIHLYHCDHRGLPLALVRRRKGQQNGAQNTMSGATC